MSLSSQQAGSIRAAPSVAQARSPEMMTLSGIQSVWISDGPASAYLGVAGIADVGLPPVLGELHRPVNLGDAGGDQGTLPIFSIWIINQKRFLVACAVLEHFSRTSGGQLLKPLPFEPSGPLPAQSFAS